MSIKWAGFNRFELTPEQSLATCNEPASAPAVPFERFTLAALFPLPISW